jgi:geranylgeranyl pyrophosphate synthase
MSQLPPQPAISSLGPAREEVTRAVLAVLEDAAPEVRDVGEAVLATQASLVRPTMLLAAAQVAAGRVPPAAVGLGCMVELIHLASVLHERGVDMAEDPKAPILLGDLFLARAMTLLAELGGGEDVASVATITGSLAEGQLVERRYRKAPQADPSVAFGHVHAFHEKRRGHFLREAAALGARAGEAPPGLAADLASVGSAIGMMLGFHHELEEHDPPPPLAAGLRDAAEEAATEARVALGTVGHRDPPGSVAGLLDWIDTLALGTEGTSTTSEAGA